MQTLKPQKYTARVSDKYFVSDNETFLDVKFELITPTELVIKHGHVSILINEEGERRSYSIASTSSLTNMVLFDCRNSNT